MRRPSGGHGARPGRGTGAGERGVRGGAPGSVRSLRPASPHAGLAVALAVLAGLFCGSGAARAGEVTGAVFVVGRDASGAEVLAEPSNDGVSPGQTLEYHFVYRNTTPGPVSGVVLNGPIPDFTRYIANTAWTDADAVFQVRLSGEDTWAPPPIVRRLTGADDAATEVVVPPSEYRGLRWALRDAVPPAATHTFRYRVRIDDD